MLYHGADGHAGKTSATAAPAAPAASLAPAVRAPSAPGARLAALMALIGLAALPLAGCSRPVALGWSAPAAQHYLDRRATQWIAWRSATRARGTVCISCHTALPYLLASDALESRTPGGALPAAQARLLASVRERVRLGAALPPYYPHQARASRATEAVLNALVLTDRDASLGRALSAPARQALAQMWALQTNSGPDAGAWPWIQFQNEPWEAGDSAYFGATLAALAVGRTPVAYRQQPDVQPALQRLQHYLGAAYDGEPLLNRIDLLWAAATWPQLLAPRAREALLAQIWAQQRPDGGWNVASLMPGWQRRDGTAPPSGSDGYATGLVTLVLQLSGVAASDPRLQHGLAWLRSHQSLWSGDWSTASMNHRVRLIHLHPDITRGFMDDAATAYALLALTRSAAPSPPLDTSAAAPSAAPAAAGSAIRSP
jgi:squalene-hopene/tetraprenyl-beta-curcumene cyclase